MLSRSTTTPHDHLTLTTTHTHHRNLASALARRQKLLGVLVRQNCVSVAISNPYLNLSEPVGAVMLRDVGGGNLKLPARSFLRLLAGEQQQLAGFVLGG